ncbi:hypothetical protein KSD_77720 [Ktedonobacter sp. SOSP1-85]|uniref:non-ribosomal peptide synthetase n=1 Tax=Ktedonobacter sp. SOSP1-85 TaxID=2778367 RepID=UPI0019167B2C|nr:non-ribosomal peptide synthetase [Ktedonobacter sp. SOSP1-85]GHO80001.1 hypothetical protein KSD_77720 [Ktedonobacter sp. SOSP1-85]
MQKTDKRGAHLSPQQARLWPWLQDKPWLRVQCALKITGDLNPRLLQQVLQHVCQRHEILRTTFERVPGMELPVQVIGEQLEVACPLISLEQLNATAQESALEEHWQDLLWRPFDLEIGPLLHTQLLRLAPQAHILLLSVHALCADMTTLKQLSIAISQAYADASRHQDDEDEEEPLQYVNVTAWLNELLQEDEAEEQFAHWRKIDLSQLQGMTLPFAREQGRQVPDWQGPAQLTFEPRHVALALGDTAQQTMRSAREHLGVSTETLLLTVWQMLLWRLAHNQDIVLGMLYDGRPYEELADLVGPYARMVPVRTRIMEGRSFAWHLQQLEQDYQQSLEKQLYFTWENTPSVTREPRYFPASIAYESWPNPGTDNPVTFSLQRQESHLEPFQLQLHIQERDGALQFRLRYNASRFAEQQIHYLGKLFVQLLTVAIKHPEAPIHTLPLLSEEEQRQVQARWQGIHRDWPFAPLHTLFTHQAEQHPQAPALRWGLDLWSYEQLEQQSNQLAHLLQQHGLRSGGRAALCLPRGATGLISLLGVLKAGGAYVPLDMEAPAARLAHLLEQIEPALIISSAQVQERLPQANAPLLLWETLGQQLATCPKTPPSVEVTPHQIAYVMYTSGSTGWPKGVEVTHMGVSNYTQALCEQLALTPGLHLATVSSLAADLGNTSIFCAWACGGCLHLLSEEQIRDGAAFADYARTSPLDVLKIVPSHLQALLAGGGSDVLPRAHLLLGGEELRWSLVEQLQQLGGSYRLYNHYGPTETTIGALVNELGPIEQVAIPPQEQRGRSVPLGRPIANMQAFILDEQQQWVPTGVSGELYLGGADLAAGYVQQPEQTQERFLELLVGGEKQRLYRTGDWVREGEEGTLTFLGRRDDQIKLRGYRIELGEIEEQVRHHGGVREAVVQLWQEEGEPEQLVGYVVPWEMPGPGAQQLREALEAQVPGYMLPSAWVQLERLPLTSNGKLDRQRLPRPERESQATPERREEARTPVEELMLGIWEEVLGRKGLGRQENFFQAGGHSLLGTRLIARVRAVFGVEIPIPWLFEAPTITQLSERVEGQLRGGEQTAIPRIGQVSREEPLPLSFAQQRLWFLDQLEPGQATYNVPMALKLKGTLVAGAFERSLQAVVNRHEVLRTTFATRDGEPVQIIHPTSQVDVTWIDLSRLAGQNQAEEEERLARLEAQAPFDLAHGPLMRVTLIKRAEDEYVLLHTAHHIISDAWSHLLWQRDMAAFYNAFTGGETVSLSELPIQYADFAAWQRNCLQGEVFQAQLDFWTRQLDSIPALSLPTDRPRPPRQSLHGASTSLVVPAACNKALKKLSQDNGATLFMLLLAAFQVLLARYTDQDDIAIGTPIEERNHTEVEELIGFFTNTLVMRGNLTGNPSFEEVLQRTRMVALEAYLHQQMPFEKLVEVLQPERDLSRSPLFQAMFILVHAESATEELHGLSLSPIQARDETAKFDLTLSLFDTGQELECEVEYCSDLFDEETMVRFLKHYQLLLETLVSHPQQRIKDIPLILEEERRQILDAWNATQVTSSSQMCLHELFAEQARRTPDAVAVLNDGEQITYSELNRRANQLAHYLQTRGITQDTAVGLCVARSIQAFICVLGILKAGGAYVALDPAYPAERLAFMLEEAAVSVLLTQPELATLFPLPNLQSIDVEQDWEYIAQESGENPGGAGNAEQLLYIIFTSGSTGRPKGVSMPHRALRNLVEWQYAQPGYSEPARVLQFSSLSFDVSFLEAFSTWYAGGSLHLISPEMQQDPVALLRYMDQTAIERAFLPFSALLHLAEAHSLSQVLPAHLRLVVSTAEALQVNQAIRDFCERLPALELINEYGPSESHVVTALRLEGAPREWTVIPDIGFPIYNTEIYLLDRSLNLVPVGVPGELYIGGVSLARGYFNRPDLTAERFIPDPFARVAGRRLYKTGDLARYGRDGAIQYLGRSDEQVKIRGYRIEPGEIEAVISGHPLVNEAALKVQGVEGRERQLVAYVVIKDGQSLSLRELRRYAGEQLPEYMLPVRLVEMERLPLSPSGKVNRKLLPDIQAGEEAKGTEERQGPRDGLEELVLQSWQQVLPQQQLGIYENFFEIGGHSLLATQVIARLRRLTGIEVPVRALFEAPTVAQLTAQLQRELRQEQQTEAPAIVPVRRSSPLLLSFAQQRLWFLDQFEPGSTAYIIPGVLRLRGVLDAQALDRALNTVVQRHEILRTTFVNTQGEPVQQVGTTPKTQLTFLDLRSFPSAAREDIAQNLVQQELAQPFDLACGPLLRGWLLQLDTDDQVLLLCMHHIISDGWSLEILMRELTVLYEALQRGELNPLPPLPVQYADYALWQRSWLQGAVLQEQLAYWKEQLSGITPLALPTDYPRPPIQTLRGARVQQILPARLLTQLHELSRREGVTLFMTLLGAFQVLLARSCGQLDIAVGTPIANRTRQEIEGLIGFFVNTLVLRGDLSGDPSFVELLTRIREVCLGAYAHQDLPFEQVVEAIQPQRDLSRSPLFQVMFTLQQASSLASEQRPLGLQIEDFPQTGVTAKFDLTLTLTEASQGLWCEMEYNLDLFKESTITLLLSHWQTLLQAIVDTPQASIQALPVLSEQERQQVLLDWNQTEAAFPQENCLHHLVEAQVARTPDAIALVYQDEQFSFSQLNARANLLAQHLCRLGVGPDVLVGIYMERSLDMVIALLATLKAGGAYIPLDPGYPQERIAFMLADSQAAVLLTHSLLREHLPAYAGQVFCLDQDWSVEESNPQEIVEVRAGHLAYMIYTSGSTGRPKGVMVTHGGICNHMHWMQDRFRFSAADRILQKTPISFDASVWEFYAPLAAGSQLILAPPESHQDSAALLKLIVQHQITTIQFVPTMLRLILQEPGIEHCQSLKSVFCGGEALTQDLQERFFALSPAKLINLYGPTETTVQVTAWECERETRRVAVPIGRPIANSKIHLLNSHMQPVPIGAPGELYIGGSGLARGYWQRPNLTAEKFVPDPYSPGEGARLYRTGDQARYREDGMLEYLGRIDQQVKLRGQRIELSEVEHVLMEHPDVSTCVALVRNDVGAETCLVAYLVGNEKASLPSISELRRFAQDKLPGYMLPTFILPLTSLPLMANGKVDVKQLPAPDNDAIQPQEAEHALSPVEELVLQSWQEVLQREQPGLFENFFEIGGHSLLATQVISRLRHMTGADIPVRTLFEAPTIAQLSKRLQQLLSQGHQQREVPPLVPVSRNQRLPLSFAQQRLWFLSQLAPESSAYTIPFTVSFQGQLDQRALQLSLEQVIQRHEVLRTTFHQQAGEPFQVIAPRAKVQIALVDLQALPLAQRQREAQTLSAQEVSVPFDLEKGPLLRCRLLRLDEQDHWLQLSMHHIISDGWSSAILVRELTSLYQGLHTGSEVVLPPLPIQYADYALWQRSWLQGEVLREQIRYWTQQLSEARSVQIPGDRAPQVMRSEQGASYEWTITEDLAQRLRQLSRQEGVTLFMLLLAGWQTLLYRLSGQEDIVVGTDSANRSHLETEGLIGFFVNLLALRTNLAGNPVFLHVLRGVREMVLGAYMHQELPFEMVVEHLRLERVGNRTPLINVLFVMQNVPASDAELPDLHVESVDREQTLAKFDLALFLLENAEGLSCSVQYSTDLYDKATIAQVMSRYTALLDDIVAHPEWPVDSLEIRSTGERGEEERMKQQNTRARQGRLKRVERTGIELG